MDNDFEDTGDENERLLNELNGRFRTMDALYRYLVEKTVSDIPLSLHCCFDVDGFPAP